MDTRKDINKAADKWLTADLEHRAQVFITAEQREGQDPRLSFSAGGNPELMVQALCEVMNKYPQFTVILADAVERYNSYKVSQN